MTSNNLTSVALLVCAAVACRGDGGTAPVERSFTLTVRGGNAQVAPALSVLPQPLSVLVSDAAGAPVKGAKVVFRVEPKAAATSAAARMVDSIGVTGADGVATAELQLGAAYDTTVVVAFPAPAAERAVTFRAVAVAPPAISSVTPDVYGSGDTVTIRGSGLSTVLSNSGGVDFGDARATALPGGTDASLRAVAPRCLAGGPLLVRVAAGTVHSNALATQYQPRSALLNLAPYQALTVQGAVLSDCLTLPANGASYLVVAQFAAVGSPDLMVDWRLGARSATASAVATRPSMRSRDALGVQREFDAFLRRSEADIAAQARAEAAANPGGIALLQGATTPPALGTMRQFRVVAAVDGSSFANVTARLKFVGNHLLLYVDTIGTGFSDAQYTTLGTTFDRDLYPVDIGAFGSESDVDHDGRIFVVFTPTVNALARAQDCVQRGYVTGFFYGTDVLVSNANSNRAEIFYSFIPDSVGRFSCAHTATDVLRILPGTFLHELQHMISFNQHVLARSGTTEETWLNEGLSHIAEELGSKLYEARFPPPSGRSTLEQIFPDSAGPFIAPQLLNAYVYLYAMREHSVTSYSGAGSVQERGATWLFLRWLGEQKGEGVFRKLVQTSKTGVANVEAQAGESFGALFGDFSVALFADSLPGLPRASVPPRFQFGPRQFRKLMAREATIAGFTDPFPLSVYQLTPGLSLQSAMLPGTMTHALVQTSAGGPSVALRFTRQDLSALPSSVAPQVTIFRLPP